MHQGVLLAALNTPQPPQYLAPLTKRSEARLARHVTADSTSKYGKVTPLRQGSFVSRS